MKDDISPSLPSTLTELWNLPTDKLEDLKDEQILDILQPYFPLLRNPDFKDAREREELLKLANQIINS